MNNSYGQQKIKTGPPNCGRKDKEDLITFIEHYYFKLSSVCFHLSRIQTSLGAHYLKDLVKEAKKAFIVTHFDCLKSVTRIRRLLPELGMNIFLSANRAS